MIRVPVDPAHPAGGNVRVTGADARHLSRVLRVKVGARVVAFARDGRAWDATVTDVGPTAVMLALGAERAASAESPCAILLGQGVGKRDKLDLVVRATTELGVAAFVPVATERAVAERDSADRVARLRKIATEACKQCGRAKVPEVHAPESLEAFLARAERAALKLVPWEEGGTPLREIARSGNGAAAIASAAVLVGPEGGLSAKEVEAARSAGFVPVTLGPRILRTETAGIVAVAALQLLLGDLG